MKKKKKGGFFRGLFKFIGILLLVIVLIVGGFLVFSSITEFKPQAKETLSLEGSPEEGLVPQGQSLKLFSWNIGYGALGDNADFFMDGGTSVDTATEARVIENIEGVLNGIRGEAPDILFLQETDRNSRRSHHIDELAYYRSAFSGFTSSFANNFKTAFVPYPLPPIGKVDSGIATFSRFAVDSAERVSLPIPFKWPVSMMNLKRCLLISRMTVEGSGKELVLINLHLEAYDDGEGKIAQTKMLLDIMEEERKKGNYVIAGGDFNQIFSTADGSAYPLQEGMWECGKIDVSGFDSSWQFLMDENVLSCRSLDKAYKDADKATFQYYLIDGFIVSGNISVSRFECLPFDFVNSDHNPTVMEFTLQ